MKCALCSRPITDHETAFCHANVGPIHYNCMTKQFVRSKPDPEKEGRMCGEESGWAEWLAQQRGQ